MNLNDLKAIAAALEPWKPPEQAVYQLTRAEYETIERRSEASPLDRLLGIPVKVIDEIPGDRVYIIDLEAMREQSLRELFDRTPLDLADLAFKVHVWGSGE
jgi:hypothetical protein